MVNFLKLTHLQQKVENGKGYSIFIQRLGGGMSIDNATGEVHTILCLMLKNTSKRKKLIWTYLLSPNNLFNSNE